MVSKLLLLLSAALAGSNCGRSGEPDGSPVAGDPRIVLTLDRVRYRLGEPIVLRVELRNETAGPLQLGPLDPRYGKLRFRVLDHEGGEVRRFESAEAMAAGWLEDASTAVQPGASRTADFVLTHYFALDAEPATYEAEVGWPKLETRATDQESVSEVVGTEYTTARTAFSVFLPDDPGELERARVFSAAVQQILDYRIPADSIPGQLAAIAGERDGYLREPASFYLGHYYESLSQFSPSSEVFERAIARYRAHLQEYPSSVFADLARKGIQDVEHRRAQESATER